jgi:hypothetical protein
MERNIFITMNKRDRRAFLQTSAGVLAASLRPAAFAKLNLGIIPHDIATGADTAQTAPSGGVNEGRKPLRLGLILGVGEDPDSSMAKVHDLGLPTCQAFVNDFKPGLAERLRKALDEHGIEATSLVVGGPGKEVWDFYQGPLTIGLVPREKGKVDFPHIIARLKELKYRGAVTIEREISGAQQVEDVRAAKAYLERLIGSFD